MNTLSARIIRALRLVANMVRHLSLAGVTFVTITALPLAKASGVPADGAPLAMHTTQEQKMLKVRIDVGGTTMTAKLEDNATARDFVSMLPLTLTLEDYAATEKVSDLPRRLSVDGAPKGITPVTGDLTYYAPWGNLAIFHKDFGYSTGLIKLGKIDKGIAILRRKGPFKVTVSLAAE
jgi:hypothetical protein